jgi:hypothetical protein
VAAQAVGLRQWHGCGSPARDTDTGRHGYGYGTFIHVPQPIPTRNYSLFIILYVIAQVVAVTRNYSLYYVDQLCHHPLVDGRFTEHVVTPHSPGASAHRGSWEGKLAGRRIVESWKGSSMGAALTHPGKQVLC